jgi:hypothetical protein
LEFSGLIRGSITSSNDDGFTSFTVFGYDLVELLKRRIVYYYSGTTQSDKTGNGERVIKEYVRENLGDLATIENGRLKSGKLDNLFVDVDLNGGGSWVGSQSFANLFTTINDIAGATGCYFTMESIFENSQVRLIFRATERLIGTDRSAQSVDRLVGRNAAGNVPVEFSLDVGNMGSPEFTVNRGQEVTAMVALGLGDGSERDVVEVTNEESIAISPYGRIEEITSAPTDSHLELTSLAQSEIQKMGPEMSFSFTVLQIKTCMYGKHYRFGDIVTAQYANLKLDYRVSSIGVSMTNGAASDSIKVEMEIV